jgi:hypothetical protein
MSLRSEVAHHYIDEKINAYLPAADPGPAPAGAPAGGAVNERPFCRTASKFLL